MDYFSKNRQAILTIKEIINTSVGTMEVSFVNSDVMCQKEWAKNMFVNLNGFELIYGDTSFGFGSLKIDNSRYDNRLKTQAYVISNRTEGEFSGGNTIEYGLKNGYIKPGTELIIAFEFATKPMDIHFTYNKL